MERISLSGNNLKTLPEEIGACVALQELYLANNAKFSSLPSSAGHLRRLQELVLRKCPALKQLPASVAGRTYTTLATYIVRFVARQHLDNRHPHIVLLLLYITCDHSRD